MGKVKDKDKDEVGEFTRPAAGEIRSAWFTLFSDPMLSLANLKAVAAAGLGAPDDDGGILLRSVYWRFYFGLLPPPTSLDLFPPALAASRKAYDELRARFLVAPDGRWAADCSGGEGYAPTTSNSVAWDPLSLDGDSPWKTWFAHLELRETIRQDVDRTFPDIPYFTIERVRKSLTTMLFVFSVLNPDVGYRQGMHELLAVCMIVVDRDSLDAGATPDLSSISPSPFSPLQRGGSQQPAMAAAMSATLDRDYVEHDAFGLFQELMRPAKSFYEWRTEEVPAGMRHTGAPQAPILERCNHLNNQLLRKIDPQLWERFEAEGVEAQIWAIRWIRLILTRELPFPMALRLWDGIFAADPNLGILDFVCIAMILLIRNELIEADYPSILTHLLHYPAPSDTYPFNPSLILSQANFLRHDTTPTAGVEVVMQNQELLGVKATDRSRINLDVDSPTAWRPGGGMTPPPRTNSARDRARAGVSGLAAGLFERAQKAGLDRAFLSTVSDFRNNLPDASTAYSFLPNFSPGAHKESFSPGPSPSNPFTTAGLPHRPPQVQLPSSGSNLSIKSMLDAERQMAEMRLAMVTMGKAMSQWMDTLKEAGQAENTAHAWSGLDRVRDSLLDAAIKDVDEMVKEWAWNDDLDSSRSQVSSTAATPIKEAPLALPGTVPAPSPTPTRATFEIPGDDDDAQLVQDTPRQPGRQRMSPPPAIPIVPISIHVPPALSTAQPLNYDTSPSNANTVNLSASPVSPGAPPTTANASEPVLHRPPEIMLSRREDRPSATLTRTPSPRTASASAMRNAQAASDPLASNSNMSSGGLRSPQAVGAPAVRILPPPRNASMRASLVPKAASAGASPALSPVPLFTPRSASGAGGAPSPGFSSVTSPVSGSGVSSGVTSASGSASGSSSASASTSASASGGAGFADPLAGLDVGSMPTRSNSMRHSVSHSIGGIHAHERKKSSWRMSTPPAGSGAGSVSISGSEPAGFDPLGARS